MASYVKREKEKHFWLTVHTNLNYFLLHFWDKGTNIQDCPSAVVTQLALVVVLYN